MTVQTMFALLFALCLSDAPEEHVVLTMGDYGSKYYRIPAIVTAQDGSLVTATDKRWNSLSDLPGQIDVVVSRSTDGGVTWSEPVTVASDPNKKGYGDASLVVDKATGIIMCIFNGLNGFWSSTCKNPIRHFYSLSYDNGVTWGPVTEFTNQTYGSECEKCDAERKKWKAMFISSGASLSTRDGRIMAVGVVQKGTGWSLMNYAVWTADLGKTWEISSLAFDHGDESKVVELNNGSILMSIRHSPKRVLGISNDGGKTWEPMILHPDIVDPACDGDIIRYTSTVDGYDRNRLIHTIPYNSGSRKNVSILISYDESNTWPIKKTIHLASSAYSSAAVLPDGRVAVYYERGNGSGYDMTCAIMTLDWITDGKDTWTPPKTK